MKRPNIIFNITSLLKYYESAEVQQKLLTLKIMAMVTIWQH